MTNSNLEPVRKRKDFTLVRRALKRQVELDRLIATLYNDDTERKHRVLDTPKELNRIGGLEALRMSTAPRLEPACA